MAALNDFRQQGEDSTGGRWVMSSKMIPKPRGRGISKSIDSLAIMPLVNRGDDLQDDYLCDGITESIINNLSQLPNLKVMARGTVFRYKGRDVDPRTIGSELGVRVVMAGQ